MGKKLGKHPDRRAPLSGVERVTNVAGRARQTLLISHPSPGVEARPTLVEPRQGRTYFDGITRLLYSGPAEDRLMYTSVKSPALGFVAVWREMEADGCTAHYALRHPASLGSLWAGYTSNNHPRANYIQTAGTEYDLELVADLSAAIDFTSRAVRGIRYIDEISDLVCNRPLHHGERDATAVAYQSNQEGLAVVATTHLRDDTTTFLAFPADNIADAEALLSNSRMDEASHNIPGGLGMSQWRTEESAEKAVSFLLAQVALTADI